jgi:hypothetical protein
MIHQASQGLASLGRNGDSMLVHMSPKEVAGLQGLAMAQGGSLTINPDTGLPEAFNLGNFITSLIPTAVGAMVGGPMGASWGLQAGSGWATAAPILAGAATGAAIAGVKGEDPLMGGIMGGVGGFGGADLAKGFTAAATPTAGGFVDPLAKSTTGAEVFASGVKTPLASGTDIMQQAATGTFNPALSSATQQAAPTIGQGFSQMGSGIKNTLGLGDIPQADAWKAATAAVPNMGTKLALTGAGGLLSGLEPSDLYGKPLKSEEDKYDPYATLNLSGDTGLRLYATGGDVYANQSSIASGGLQSLYGTSDNSGGRQPLSRDGYGIGRLENLTAEGSRAKAANTFYAGGGAIAFDKGGYLNGAGDGMSDSIPATIEGKQPARLADGEFVVPADVVSHLGNGSSKAGSKRLYAMLDKVRHARTGNKKQGKEINPAKYMPA